MCKLKSLARANYFANLGIVGFAAIPNFGAA